MSERNKVIDVDSAGNENFNGLFGESIAEQRHDDVSVQFQYNYYDEQFDVDPELVTGDGVTTVANSLATVSSAAAGTAMRHSKDSIRYNPAHTGYSYMTASFNGAGIGRAGCFDDTDGFALQVSDGVASFGYLKDGVHKGNRQVLIGKRRGGVSDFVSDVNFDNDPRTATLIMKECSDINQQFELYKRLVA